MKRWLHITGHLILTVYLKHYNITIYQFRAIHSSALTKYMARAWLHVVLNIGFHLTIMMR